MKKNKLKKILIVGAGWYGCHIGLYLKQKKHNVKIYEKSSDIFLGSSGYNQFRLHTGYHYPRSSKTIEEAKKNYFNFVKRYKKFISFPKKNIYCIAKEKSLIDAKTYEIIIKSHNLKFSKKKINVLQNIEGSYNCNEGILLNGKIKKFFKKNLKENLFFNTKVKNIEKEKKKYDFVLDCTNTTLDKKLNNNFNYVLTISLVYRKNKKHSVYPITIMDGKLPSLYPYADKKDMYTLTHSDYTHIKKFKNFDQLEQHKTKIKTKTISKIRDKMENDMTFFFPSFKKIFKYSDYFLSYKVLPNDNSARRPTFIEKKGNLISCTSPKIGNIFSLESYIKKIIK
tara:strand:- start:25 stop:1041 length:1017 start_codon:yes stop_codon:yes gene_type:complete